MTRFALTSALVLALAAPAFAGGKEQFAAQLGVNADAYTLSQLIALETAKLENDAQGIAFVKAQAEGNIASTQGSVSLGQEQMAAALGVNASDYTLAQLIRLDSAVRDNDPQEIAFVKAQAEGRIVSTQGAGSPGHDMLASILGVNGAEYTTAELSTLAAWEEQ